MRHSLEYVLIAALVVMTTACGGGNGGGSPSAPSPTTTNIVISGYTDAITGSAPRTFPLTATANMSTGTTQNVSAQATWASDAPMVASVAAGGVVTTTGNGSANITAAYDGAVGRVTIAVNPELRAVPVMTGILSIGVSSELDYLYRGQLLLTFKETGGGVAYDVTEIQVFWNNAYWEKVLTSIFNPTEIASAFGGSSTVPAGGTRTMAQVVDYTYTQSGMTVEVLAHFRDSLGNTSTATGTYSSALMTGVALKPSVGPEGIVVVRR